MDTYLNHKLDFVFIITPNILLKHNNYLNQNIKTDNYFMEILIYDYNDPLNNVKNYFFTIKKILKISIMRKYTNIMILHSEILLKNDWIKNLNDLIEKEIQINKNNFGMIWLESEQFYFTDYQLNEINTKQYYTHNLTTNENSKLSITYGNNGMVISKKVFFNLYRLINENLDTSDPNDLKECFSYACYNVNSYIIYPNVLINIDKLKPLYNELEKIKNSKETKMSFSKTSIINQRLKTLIYNSTKNKQTDTTNIIDLDELKKMISDNIISELHDIELLKVHNDYVIPYLKQKLIYNPNYFNVYFNFTKEILQHFDWIFYKYFYEDTLGDENIGSYEDSITHYLFYGYKELRYICIDEYLYDKNDSELEANIKSLQVESYYESNKEEIDKQKLSIRPVIYYIKYDYENKS
jgi:hypothetical protein